MYNIIYAQIFTQQTADTVYSVVGNVRKSWNPPTWKWLHMVDNNSHPTDTTIITLNNVIIITTKTHYSNEILMYINYFYFHECKHGYLDLEPCGLAV